MAKVIKGLTLCIADGYCNDCPYEEGCFDEKSHMPFGEEMMRDALALLKDQETSDTGRARIFQCEKCGYGFDDIFLTDEHNYDIEPRYCPNCGRLVKRDG